MLSAIPYPHNEDGTTKTIEEMTLPEVQWCLALARKIRESPPKALQFGAAKRFNEHWCQVLEKRIAELEV